MKRPGIFQAASFVRNELNGISDRTLEVHFALYEGYVKASNELNEQIFGLLKNGRVEPDVLPTYSQLTRRLEMEYNRMVLHEYYFGNLKNGGSDHPDCHSGFAQAAENSYGSFDLWKRNFFDVGMLRGVGWAICYLNPVSSLLSNHWISLHDYGPLVGFVPVLVMDVWEHAYLLDYEPGDRASYIEAFFSNIAWKAVELRLEFGVPALAGAGRG